MKIIFSALIALIAAAGSTSLAAPNHCDQLPLSTLESLPILQGGRVKPLYVHARESLRYLTGKKSPLEINPVAVYCQLSLQGGTPSAPLLRAPIEHKKLKSLLKKLSLPYNELLDKVTDLRQELSTAQEGSSYKRALEKILNRIFLYKEIVSAKNWTLYSTQADWTPVGEIPAKELDKKLNSSNAQYIKNKGGKVSLELTYAKMRLPLISLIITLLALITMVVFKHFYISLGFAAITLITQTVLIILRIIISERAPITNMYETVLFSGYAALVLSLIIGHLKKEKIFVYLGLGYNTCTLIMLNFADGMLSDEINPLVPVLRDNFWLSTHVTMVIISYGALALSWVLANTVLLKRKFSHITPKEENYYCTLAHDCVKYGVVLLAGGIILGGIWADYSWGRFWGWDPKETGSLIALCIYIAILHGRHTNWISRQLFIPLIAGAFLSIMMAWFGVNYILASGLHSYGFSEGGAIFLASFTALQLFILVLTKQKKEIA